jgi:voltage-gated potassium channel
MLFAAILIITIIVIGTVSYTLIEGWTLLEALYATIITLTTVGYGDLSPQTTGGRIFAIFFTLMAIGIAGYAISTLAAFVIEREQSRIKQRVRERRMKQIAKLENHFILCGGGYIGKRVAHEFYRNQAPFVIVEENEDLLRWTLLYLHQDYVSRKIQQFREMDYLEHDTSEFEAMPIANLAEEVEALFLQEDATQDKTLLRAGIARAQGLVVATDDDRQNLFVVLGARQLAARLNNPNLRIVTRVIDEENKTKLLAAGANKVLSPNVIGGFQIAVHMLAPEIGSFWDHMLYGDKQMLRFSELRVKDHPDLVGQTVYDVRKRENKIVVAIKRDEHYLYTPDPDTTFDETDILILLGAQTDKMAVAGFATRY